MARIRSIKPEFWTSEQVMDLSRDARLLFIGMWNFCDDRGVHPASCKTLKAKIFPSDDILCADVALLVEEMIRVGLVAAFEANGESWWHITGWHHQVINRPSKSRYPEPPRIAPPPSAARSDDDDNSNDAPGELPPKSTSSVPGSGVDSLSLKESFMGHSLSPPGVLTEHSRTEGKGREGSKPKPSSVTESDVNPTPLPPNSPGDVTRSTRRGMVCGLLRKAGMSDAAPHYLTDEAWTTILEKRTDEEIVEVAKAKMASRPNQRIGLKYIAPALLEDPLQPVKSTSQSGKHSGFENIDYRSGIGSDGRF